jgi:peptidoglycan hydrolase-like protein with peptidoglycan-binding domain
VVLLAALAGLPAFATTAHRAASRHTTHGARRASAPEKGNGALSTSSRTTHGTHKKVVPKSRRLRGQQVIAPERVIEIQQALIREHYFHGEANGQWDATTKAAMQKYQADQGWQTKLMPDSRALKKLGLGPDYSNAINAKNSSFAVPPASSTTPPVQSEGFAEAAGVSR